MWLTMHDLIQIGHMRAARVMPGRGANFSARGN